MSNFTDDILSGSDLQQLSEAGAITIPENHGLQSVAAFWLEPAYSVAARNEYVTAARTMLTYLSKVAAVVEQNTVGAARLRSDLLEETTLYGVENTTIIELFEKFKLELTKLQEKANAVKSKHQAAASRVMLALLLREYYRLDGSSALPSNEPIKGDETQNSQAQFVREFARIIATKVAKPSAADSADTKFRATVINYLRHRSLVSLIGPLRDAKDLALVLERDMPNGFKIQDGEITGFKYDPFLDDSGEA